MAEMQLGNKRTFSFFVETPVGGDDVPRWRVPRAFLAQTIHALLVGGGLASFDWELRYSASANDTGAGTLLESDTGVTNNTTGVLYLPPFDPGDPAIIPAGNWIWLELPVVSVGIARPVAATLELVGVELGP
jgi:hypothetical protein